MIERLLEMVDRKIEEHRLELAALENELQALRGERAYWLQWLKGTVSLPLTDGPAIRDWLAYGAKADRTVKILTEKDFLVETRIMQCRTELRALAERRQRLEDILARRERHRRAVAERRAVRRLHEQAMARHAAKEGENGSWP
ncbi:MAG: hypothetical protein OWU84_05500 [Firmicutes bacterium]|nr:hypothetical protein [Bacillota bacterium]